MGVPEPALSAQLAWSDNELGGSGPGTIDGGDQRLHRSNSKAAVSEQGMKALAIRDYAQ